MAEVYTPSTSPISSISSLPLDPNRCKAGVWGNERWASYGQCSRKPFKDGWCKQHHPDSERERQEITRQKAATSDRKASMGWYGERMMAALIKIRDGDNDPRTTATEVLASIPYAQGEP